jgi:hypothetical protein
MSASPTTSVQNALTALFPIKAGAVDGLREKLKTNALDPSALNAVGTVHFARIFVFEPNNPSGVPSSIAAVITTYDGDFGAYIQDFVNEPDVAAFFDTFLAVIDDPDAAGIIPVVKNASAFAAFVEKYDSTNPTTTWGQWYSAYPELTVTNILNPPKS